MPNVIVISGPNGAGKSTLAPYLLRQTFGIVEFVNADTIAQELSEADSGHFAIRAGKIMLEKLNELAAARKNFAFETTLAPKFYSRWLKELQSSGYLVHLTYLWLKESDLAVERVAERVRLGGHDIPKKVIERRFERGWQNLLDLYLPLADSWQVYDASPLIPQLIANGDKINGENIFQPGIWEKIKK